MEALPPSSFRAKCAAAGTVGRAWLCCQVDALIDRLTGRPEQQQPCQFILCAISTKSTAMCCGTRTQPSSPTSPALVRRVAPHPLPTSSLCSLTRAACLALHATVTAADHHRGVAEWMDRRFRCVWCLACVAAGLTAVADPEVPLGFTQAHVWAPRCEPSCTVRMRAGCGCQFCTAHHVHGYTLGVAVAGLWHSYPGHSANHNDRHARVA